MLLLETLSMHGTVVMLAIGLSVPTELTDVSHTFQVFVVIGHFICPCFILFPSWWGQHEECPFDFSDLYMFVKKFMHC